MSKTSKQKSKAKTNRRKPVARASRLAKSKKFSKTSHSAAKRTIIGIIIFAMVVVIAAVVVALLNTPERRINREIESIARDYYENYYYDQLVRTSTSTGKPLNESLEHYAEVGFSKVNLSQLFLFDNGRHRSVRSSITEYCDESNTYVTIYPESPFGRTNYHIDYNYSCNF